MKIEQLATKPNLKLAWRRITTGTNQQYKRFYRPLYYAYEVALDANLADLRQRLLGGSFQPEHPQRVYLPKASGLHRPLSLLHIEDQIVLQAFANLAAKRMQKKREPLQFRVVFSNILQRPDSIFFFRRWQYTYREFQRTIETSYEDGMRWVGDFDLAAFYDTIPHELLLRTIYPRTTNAAVSWIVDCLKVWSSGKASSGHGHGLPQGPLASDFLAECFLLPIDQALRDLPGYTRYVDDVRLLGETEDEVRSRLIELERHCRERGLIPQTGKFAIKRAHNVEEAIGMLPSISDPQHEDAGRQKLGKAEALHAFQSAIGGRPYRVTDKTRLRFVLYRAGANTRLLGLVLRLLPRHPEHADAFFHYLGQFTYRRPIERLCLKLVRDSPYSYVRGEAWNVLARYNLRPQSVTATRRAALGELAVTIARCRSRDNFVEKWGACHFLCTSEEAEARRQSRWLRSQPSLLQALTASALPAPAFQAGRVVGRFLKARPPEPALSVCSALSEMNLDLSTFGVAETDLPSQAANTLRELGLVSSPGAGVDPIAEILNARYGAPGPKSWRKLLRAEYIHALGLLKQAEATFDSGRSFWLACQNSFNQIVFLALQRHLAATNHPAACTTVDKNGQLVDFGVTLDRHGPFSRNFPNIGTCFREMNARRNHLPVAHPYEKKTAAQSHYLKAQERDRIVAQLRTAYADFVGVMP